MLLALYRPPEWRIITGKNTKHFLYRHNIYLDISSKQIRTFLKNLSSTMSTVSNKQVSRTPKSLAHFTNASENEMPYIL